MIRRRRPFVMATARGGGGVQESRFFASQPLRRAVGQTIGPCGAEQDPFLAGRGSCASACLDGVDNTILTTSPISPGPRPNGGDSSTDLLLHPPPKNGADVRQMYDTNPFRRPFGMLVVRGFGVEHFPGKKRSGCQAQAGIIHQLTLRPQRQHGRQNKEPPMVSSGVHIGHVGTAGVWQGFRLSRSVSPRAAAAAGTQRAQRPSAYRLRQAPGHVCSNPLLLGIDETVYDGTGRPWLGGPVPARASVVHDELLSIVPCWWVVITRALR